MLSLRGDDVVLVLGLVEAGDPLDGQVVALRRPRGEDDLLRRGSDQRADLFTGLLRRLYE